MLHDLIIFVAGLVVVVVFVYVVNARRRSYQANAGQLAEENVCPHLKPALDLLLARGHTVLRVGQKHPELPLEIHLRPPFDPRAVSDELKLGEPVFVSDRNVLYCKEDWCELHPKVK
jgi:hypothetical protein